METIVALQRVLIKIGACAERVEVEAGLLRHLPLSRISNRMVYFPWFAVLVQLTSNMKKGV